MTDVSKAARGPAADRCGLIEEAFNNLSLGIVIFDGKREVVFCNPRYREIYGLSAEQVKRGTPTSDLIRHRLNLGLKVEKNPEDYIRERVGKPVAQREAVQEFADGRIIRYAIHPLSHGGGMATHEDITEREEMSARLKRQYELGREQEEKLQQRNLQFDTAINNMSQGLCFFDADHRLIVCNERYIEMYDLPSGRVGPGTPLSEVVDLRFEAGSFPAMTRDEYMQWRSNVAISAEPTDSIVELRNGRTFLIRHRPMPDLGWVATHEDITEKRQTELKIEHMAHHDSLTDLANRVRLNERLDQALAQSADRRSVAVHHLDLDRFKAVNDTFGHHAGDNLLKIVAGRLRDLVRGCDTIARMGGDEFVIVQAPISGPVEATALAERMIAAIGEPVMIDGHQAGVGASVGIAVGPGDGPSPEKLLRNADLALYAAKNVGKSQWRHYEPWMRSTVMARLELRSSLERAIDDDALVVEYQPIVGLADGQPTGFEALLRWEHPSRGRLSPDQFIDVAEESGLIAPIGEWVMRTAMEAALSWGTSEDSPYVGINVSARQFRTPGFTATVHRLLAQSGLRPDRVTLEITESLLLRDDDSVWQDLQSLRRFGVRIAIDDFGTGYSALSYLRHVPLDVVKLDRSFIQSMAASVKQRELVQGIVGLADVLGLQVIAEGIETEQERDLAARIGCAYGQGFLFSPALPVDETRSWLRRRVVRPPAELAARRDDRRAEVTTAPR